MMLNNPWMLPDQPGLEGGTGHMVVQTQSVSISSGDGSVIQTNTYESWVTVTGTQPMGLDIAPNLHTPNLFGSVNLAATSIVNPNPQETLLAVSDRLVPLSSLPSESITNSMPGLTVGVPTSFMNQGGTGLMEPIVALPQQMSVPENPVVAAIDNGRTYIAVPVSGSCEQLISVPTVQNLYNPVIDTTAQLHGIQACEATVTSTQGNSQPWYLLVQNSSEPSPVLARASSVPTGELKCPSCSSVFEKWSCLEWHARYCRVQNSLSPVDTPSSTTADTQTLSCVLCKRLFSATSPLISPQTFICVECNTTINPVSFEAQVKREYFCPECDESFSYELDLDEHRNIHKSSVTICELPDNYVSNSVNDVCVKVEPPDDSEDDSRYEPESSSTSSSSDESADELDVNISGSNCPECGKTFTCTVLLKKHIQNHSDIRSYRCPKCGKICVGTFSLQQHSWMHSEDVERSMNVDEPDSDTDDSDDEESTKDISTSQPYGCAECGRQFSDSNDLKEHCVTHLHAKPFSCTQCGERFETTAVLESHWWVEHNNGHCNGQ